MHMAKHWLEFTTHMPSELNESGKIGGMGKCLQSSVSKFSDLYFTKWKGKRESLVFTQTGQNKSYSKFDSLSNDMHI